MRLKYFGSCVDWPRGQVPALIDMIKSGRSITRETFLKHTDRQDRAALESALGYTSEFPISRDCTIRYYSGRLNGARVYWLR